MTSAPCGRESSAISTVDIKGTDDVDTDDLKDRITTRETSRFLGVIYGFVGSRVDLEFTVSGAVRLTTG